MSTNRIQLDRRAFVRRVGLGGFGLGLGLGTAHPAAAVSDAHEARRLHDALQRQAEHERRQLPDDAHHPPAVSAVVMDVRRQVSVGVDATAPVYLASGVKLFVLVELYR